MKEQSRESESGADCGGVDGDSGGLTDKRFLKCQLV